MTGGVKKRGGMAVRAYLRFALAVVVSAAMPGFGQIMELIEDIPQPGRQVQVDGFLFIVGAVSRNKILEVEVRRVV